ncbi:MAG: EF-P lysine aminoacylase EpmA [Desulfobacterales bacterium]|nr:EF-P lysine aminoacylase EpmA [Desulfobacterales bacterium]
MAYRQQQIRTNLERRARLLTAVRAFFASAGYLEVETPVRIPAVAPEAHIDPVTADGWYLHTSPELAMKRLLAAGYRRIFQICRCFRRGERGGRHLPEFTLLEWYTANENYRHMMAQTEALIRQAILAVSGSGDLAFQGRIVDLAAPFDRITVDEAFARWAGCTPEKALTAGRFDEVMGLEIEPRLGWKRPAFLYDYPAACAALARLRLDRPAKAERFELYIGGLELCNGFSELTAADEQRRRFETERDMRRRDGREAPPMPEPFLAALADMPPAAGNALGVDRLVMLLADTTVIDEVNAFVPEEL